MMMSSLMTLNWTLLPSFKKNKNKKILYVPHTSTHSFASIQKKKKRWRILLPWMIRLEMGLMTQMGSLVCLILLFPSPLPPTTPHNLSFRGLRLHAKDSAETVMRDETTRLSDDILLLISRLQPEQV